MTDQRTIEDRLREEYSLLLPDIRRVTEQLESEVRYCVLPILRTLNKYEQLIVKSRIKECESAIDSLRRKPLVDPETGEQLGEGKTFDRGRPTLYTLTYLNDLAGVRVLAFPRRRVTEVDQSYANDSNRGKATRSPVWVRATSRAPSNTTATAKKRAPRFEANTR